MTEETRENFEEKGEVEPSRPGETSVTVEDVALAQGDVTARHIRSIDEKRGDLRIHHGGLIKETRLDGRTWRARLRKKLHEALARDLYGVPAFGALFADQALMVDAVAVKASSLAAMSEQYWRDGQLPDVYESRSNSLRRDLEMIYRNGGGRRRSERQVVDLAAQLARIGNNQEAVRK